MKVRPYVDDDAPTVAALISAEEKRLYGPRPGGVTGDDIRMFLQVAKEAWIWEDDARVVASATFGVHGDAANIRGVVADKGRGIGTEILERGEAFARVQGATKILTGAPEPDTAARALFESRGYREVRRFYEMAIELAEEPSEPIVPAGLVLDGLREDEVRGVLRRTERRVRGALGVAPGTVRGVARAPPGPAPRRARPDLVRRPRR
jgi:Sortase and related acyltransferases